MNIKTAFAIALVSVAFLAGCAKDKTPVTLDCPNTISFSTQIFPMISGNCLSCHDTGGSLPTLSNHSQVAASASSISGSLHGAPQLMPQGGPALADSLIQQFDCWVAQGKLDN
jgi:hypothetical protein